MNDVNRALQDIAKIRNKISEVQLFRGFGPLAIGLTGGLAICLSALQSITSPSALLAPWIVLAGISAAMIGSEMWALTRRAHGAIAYDLLWAIVQRFLPCFMAGAAIGWIILAQAPEQAWLLPGLWQILIGLGVFAAMSMLPQNIIWVGGWYLVAGVCVLLWSAQSLAISTWFMGVPFGVGQILMACLLHWAPEKKHGG